MPTSEHNLKFVVQTAMKNGGSRNEDAYQSKTLAPSSDAEILLALADGTSDAIFSGEWADSLVQAASPEWCRLKDETLTEKIRKIGEAHQARCEKVITDNLFVKNKFATVGSQATFLMAHLEMLEGDSYSVRAIAVGDSCLFKVDVKKQKLVTTFPLRKLTEFEQNPHVIAHRLEDRLHFIRGKWTLAPDEILLLASDAIAKWLWKLLTQGRWDIFVEQVLPALESQEKFAQFVATQREAAEHRLWNDDATLMLCMSQTVYDQYLSQRLATAKLPGKKAQPRTKKLTPSHLVIGLLVALVLGIGWTSVNRSATHKKFQATQEEVGQYFTSQGEWKEYPWRAKWSQWQMLERHLASMPEFCSLKNAHQDREALAKQYAEYLQNLSMIEDRARLKRLEEIRASLVKLLEHESQINVVRLANKLEEQINTIEKKLVVEVKERLTQFHSAKLTWEHLQKLHDCLSSEQQKEYQNLQQYFAHWESLQKQHSEYGELASNLSLSSRIATLEKIKSEVDILKKNEENTAKQIRTIVTQAQSNKIGILENHLKSFVQESLSRLQKLRTELENVKENVSNNSTYQKLDSAIKELQVFQQTVARDKSKKTLEDLTEKSKEINVDEIDAQAQKLIQSVVQQKQQRAEAEQEKKKNSEALATLTKSIESIIKDTDLKTIERRIKQIKQMKNFTMPDIESQLVHDYEELTNKVKDIRQKTKALQTAQDDFWQQIKALQEETQAIGKIGKSLDNETCSRYNSAKQKTELFTCQGKNAQGHLEFEHIKTQMRFVLIHEAGKRAYLIGKYEVTEKVWSKIMGTNSDSELPVSNVSWPMCQKFCEKTGLNFPTGTEWEIACRAQKTTTYYWGDNYDAQQADQHGWVWASFSKGVEPEKQKVGTKTPNAYGVYDMIGNVWEWVADAKGKQRIMRGGSVYAEKKPEETYRFAAEREDNPQKKMEDVGFRCAFPWDLTTGEPVKK